MSTVEAEATTTTQETQETQDKMSVDEHPKREDQKDEEKKEETKEEEEKKESGARRRSSRITATTSAVPASDGTPSKAKRGGGRAAKKRSADDLAGADGADGKPKKAKKADEAEAGLKLGEPLPDLLLKNEQGEEVKVQSLAENKKGVVLFLVPKADTPGCTTQACGFRDMSSDFTSLDFAVYCLSADAPDKQKKWKDKKSLPFPLLSDPDRALIEKLTGNGAKTPRSHFVFAGGKLVDKRMPVKPVDSPRLAFEFIKALEVGKTEAPEAVREPDNADVAAASAAASAAVEPAEPVAASTSEETEGAPAPNAETAAAS
ncbi:AhpC-TSA-domain-containing protein [Sanghuangporus baumii]|uniref:thioredoxin-dependent peroxiredoxin n=1 Tax=Sanghuangporus baumii TaxID=108892 RepID=A0A9Q5I0P5_SANBA|nr:AhpC-TSA-domain-containing protein [Sanghuangporus baumii]